MAGGSTGDYSTGCKVLFADLRSGPHADMGADTRAVQFGRACLGAGGVAPNRTGLCHPEKDLSASYAVRVVRAESVKSVEPSRAASIKTSRAGSPVCDRG